MSSWWLLLGSRETHVPAGNVPLAGKAPQAPPVRLSVTAGLMSDVPVMDTMVTVRVSLLGSVNPAAVSRFTVAVDGLRAAAGLLPVKKAGAAVAVTGLVVITGGASGTTMSSSPAKVPPNASDAVYRTLIGVAMVLWKVGRTVSVTTPVGDTTTPTQPAVHPVTVPGVTVITSPFGSCRLAPLGSVSVMTTGSAGAGAAVKVNGVVATGGASGTVMLTVPVTAGEWLSVTW